MFSTNFDNIANDIKGVCESQAFKNEKPKYLNRITGIVNSSLGVETWDSLPSASLRDKVKLFNQSLEKCQVHITPDEIQIWRTSNHPLLVEAAKLLEIKNLVDKNYPTDSAGCNIVIMKGDALLAQHSRGFANVGSPKPIPMNITQRQHFGSVSKHFTAACVIQLENSGQLSLQDDIRKHFPELPPFYFHGKEVAITIDQLLTMRSGLPNMQVLAFLAGFEDQDASSKDKLNLVTSQQKIELGAMPGAEFNYCNTNYDILAKIVENVLVKGNQPQKNLKEYADEYFFKPLEMTQTGFIDPDRDIYTQTIPGYTVISGQLVDETTRNKTWGPCGIIGTPEDMVKWNGRCPQEIFDKLAESPVPLQPEAFSYGRGINVGYFDNGRYKIMVHSGGIEGFMTRYFKVIDQPGS
jgi:CubicO group peptidase (beta-lactamase class C family)